MAEAESHKKKPVAKGLPKGAHKLNRPRLTISSLTVEQEAYCRGRAMGMSVEEALLVSNSTVGVRTARGWESPKCKRNFNQAIVNRINELAAMAQKNAILKAGLDREWVITRFMQVAERCMQAEPVRDREGNPTGEFTFNAAGANQALRALGDVLGLFRPVEKKPGDEYEHLTDDDIARIAAELAAQTGLLEIGERAQAAARREQACALQALPQAG